jgi:hypothetical protein
VVLLANPYLFQEEEGPISVILKVDITIYDTDTPSRTQSIFTTEHYNNTGLQPSGCSALVAPSRPGWTPCGSGFTGLGFFYYIL